MSQKYPLQETLSPINKDGRDRINENWTRIMAYFDHVHLQIKALAGGREVGELIARLEQAIEIAETEVQKYIVLVDTTVRQAIEANNTATQDAIAANNAALQMALDTVANRLIEVTQAISNAEMATQEATNAKNAAIQATQDAQDAINTMQSLIDNFGSRGTWSTTTQYYKNNLTEVDGRTYIALKENINTPVTDKSTWALFADKGIHGAEGPRGLPGKDGKDGTGVNIIGGLTSEDDLPTVGTPGDAYMIGGDLYVWQDDTGSWKNVGPIQGPEGKSAYDLAVENGFEGTMEEWIVSLKGEQGPPGPDGPPGPPGKDADLTEITEQLEQLEQTTENHIGDNAKHLQPGQSDKINNSWQKGVYNDTNITNLGANCFSKTYSIAASDWKSAVNTEVLFISLPVTDSSGVVRLTFSTASNASDAAGGATVEFIYQIYDGNVFFQNKNIVSINSKFASNYFIADIITEPTSKELLIPVYKAPLAKNPLLIKLEVTSKTITFDTIKNSLITIDDSGSPTGFGYPWTPQKSLDQRITENFTLFSSFKTKIASATTDKGVPTNADATGDQMAANIRAIPSGGRKEVQGSFSVPALAPKATSQNYVTPLVDFQPMMAYTDEVGAVIFNGTERWEGTDAYSNGFHTLRAIPEQVGSQWRVTFRFYNALNYNSATRNIPYILLSQL